MVVSERKTKRICSFYVSDFHLEMIIVPYINNKLNNGEKINIITQKNMKETVEILISKMNINRENKEKILNLNWDNKKTEKIEENSTIFIIGENKFIEKINNEIKKENITIVNCYDFEENKENMENIIEKHDETLNTLRNI